MNHERAAFAAAQRRERQRSLAQGAADRRGLEPQRDRRAGGGGYGDGRQAQAVLAQSSYLSVNDRRLHFGLGAATTANLEIRWPNGGGEKIADVAADQLVVIREGSGIVKRESFRKVG